jgi:hypothetical protein
MNAEYRKDGSRQNNSEELNPGRREKNFALKIKFSEIAQNETGEFDPKNDPLRRLGIQLRLKRIKAGFDAVEFAVKIGIEIEALAAIEFGYAPLQEVDKYLDAIAEGLGIPSGAIRNFLGYLISEGTA